MIVVDTNVIAYFLIQGDKTEQARRLWHSEPAWHVPSLWRHEFLNILSTFVRHGGSRPEEALGLWNRALELLEGQEVEVNLVRALELAIELDLSAYDAQYVALAQKLEAPLVTEDRRLLRAAVGIGVSMEAFLSSESS